MYFYRSTQASCRFWSVHESQGRRVSFGVKSLYEVTEDGVRDWSNDVVNQSVSLLHELILGRTRRHRWPHDFSNIDVS